MNVTFPEHNTQRYYPVHFKYVLDILKYDSRVNLTVIDLGNEVFVCTINDKIVYFDYSDFFPLGIAGDNSTIFKFHYDENIQYPDNVKPFTPISFYDWDEFFNLQNTISYTASTNLVSSRQHLRSKSYACKIWERRNNVQTLLKNKYKHDFTNKIIRGNMFFKDVENILAAVCVPGQNDNMLDRGHLQYIGLGCCTISPNLPETLPYNKKLIPNVHYLQCENDYSDLIDIIEWCKCNRNKCIEIGNNAKQLFTETSTPEKLVDWIEICI